MKVLTKALWHPLAALAIVASLAAPAAAEEKSTTAHPSEVWQTIKSTLWPDQKIEDGSDMISLDTPYRAADAAAVPVGISIDPGKGHTVTEMTLIIEQNPAPVAASFTFGRDMGRVVNFSTNVRVNDYSNIRVVAKLDDGTLHDFARYVKASGGCSAPAVKDPDAAMAEIGRMKLRRFEMQNRKAGEAEAQVMIRHPQNSGLQVDQVTQLPIPAFFIDQFTVKQGDQLLWKATGGISISEDPSFRFTYVPNGARTIELVAHDTRDEVFKKSFPVQGAS